MSAARYCLTCSYDLRQTPARCPECGRPFDPANPRTFASKPPRPFLVRWLRRLAAAVFAIIFLLAATWSWFYWGWRTERNAIAAMTHPTGPETTSEPIGGEKFQHYLGRAGFVLNRVRRLEYYWMSAREMTDADLDQMVRLKYLKVLDLSQTFITNASHLSGLPNLVQLELHDTNITDAGLADLTHLKSLKEISLKNSKATPAALRFFPPSVMVTVSGLPNNQERVPGTLGQTLPVPFAAGPDPLANAQSFEYAYRPLGNMNALRIYYLPGEQVGTRNFYSNGNIADEQLMRDGQLQGLSRKFYESGKLLAEFPYTNGKLNGTVRFFKENGELLGQSTLTNGTGILRQYQHMPVSMEESETPYKDGLIDGVVRTWGRFVGCTGIGCDCVNYIHGQQEGWAVTLDQDNKLTQSAYSQHGKLHGVLREFTAPGVPSPGFPAYYIDGNPVSEAAYRLAAQKDPVLQLSLTDDGYAWARHAMGLP